MPDNPNIKQWLKLWFAPTIYCTTLPAIHMHLLPPETLLKVFAGQEREYFTEDALDYISCRDDPRIEQHLTWGQLPGNHLIAIDDLRYPSLLKEIACPPLVLFGQGNIDLLTEPQIAMVGSRRPTASGINNAKLFARELSKAGLIITSGMALGIDAASHQGALEADCPTIAVFGTGVDVPYPKRHLRLADQIREHGLLLSEFPLGTAPHPGLFPRRNRIVSGMTLGTLVVEAGQPSGTLITAKLAADQGRSVFAIPSSIHNPMARGCHHLIDLGAKLTQCPADILQELCLTSLPNTQQKTEHFPQKQLDRAHKKLLECVAYESTSFDTICHSSGLQAPEVARILLNLTLSGHIYESLSGYMRATN